MKESTVACADFGRFHSTVSLVSFAPFTTADMAIENISAVTKGGMSCAPFFDAAYPNCTIFHICKWFPRNTYTSPHHSVEVTPFLANFLKLQIGSKKDKSEIGVADPALGQSIKADLGVCAIASSRSQVILGVCFLQFCYIFLLAPCR